VNEWSKRANRARAFFDYFFDHLDSPLDAETARAALRRQVIEYGSEEARQIVNALDQADEML
jgi:hypothetical protein